MICGFNDPPHIKQAGILPLITGGGKPSGWKKNLLFFKTVLLNSPHIKIKINFMKKLIVTTVLAMFVGFCFAQTAFGPEQIITSNANITNDLFSIDIDNDGDNDVLAARMNGITWYENDGNGSFSNQQVIAYNPNIVHAIYSIDLDNDGDNDVLSASLNDDKIAWYENDGSGNFINNHIITLNADRAWDVYSIDLDNDGDYDVISASEYDNKVAWYENDSSGGFGNQNIVADNFDDVKYIFSIDLDNDGDNDIISASGGSDGMMAWYDNDGFGNFDTQHIITTDIYFGSSIYSSDLDNDDDKDILLASFDKIIWFENDGIGGFGDQQILLFEYIGVTSVYSVDLDNDGDNDVLFSSYQEDKIAWYENNGDGGFGNQQIITIEADEAWDVYSIDLDNDGDNDVLSASDNDEKIAWYENYYNKKYYINSLLCDGDSMMINGEWVTSSGIYYDTIQNIFGGDSIVFNTVEIIPSPNEFDIIGSIEVDELTIETYFVPPNEDVIYGFEIENGDILSTQENSVEVQWGVNGIGLVKATATFPDTGCDTESILEVDVGLVNVGEFSKLNIKLFPNPANKTLFLQSNILPVFIEIINSTGHLVLISDQQKIDVSGLGNNIYYVKVYDEHDNLLQITKLVVLR